MTEYLLDTNVASELTRAQPNAGVIDFLSAGGQYWISVISVHELAFGIELLPAGQCRDLLEATIGDLLDNYSDHVIAIEIAEAVCAARLRAEAQLRGRTMHLADALIAATAIENTLTLATRNVSDFATTNVSLVNPWDAR